MLRVISLGWGVQSFTLAAMSALGELPPVDAAIHADTTHERSETYTFAARWTPWLEERGVRVVTVRAGGVTQVMFSETDQTMIPLYLTTQPGPRWRYGQYIGEVVLDEVIDEMMDEREWVWYDNPTPYWSDAKQAGVLRRSCTHRWKIVPQRRWIAAELERRGLSKTPGVVEQWFGITLDEVQRMKPSDVQYIENRYPFIEMLDRPWTRGMVMRWLQDNDLEIPVKSACTFCPFHDRAIWREIKRSSNGDWQMAVAVDRAIRHKRPGYLAYVASARQPLEEIDFRSEEDLGQLTLWNDAECEGMCFL